MSQCCVPNCNLKQQQHRQEQVQEEHNLKSSSHVHMSNNEVAELTWENGQLAMHGLGGLLTTAQTKPTWTSRAHDTLESIVQQATCQHQNSNLIMPPHHTPTSTGSTVAAAGGKTPAGNPVRVQSVVPMLTRKRTLSDSGFCGRNLSSKTNVLEDEPSGGRGSASATFCRDKESTMMSLASYETGRSLESTKILDEDSPSHYGSENQEQEEDRDTKVETSRSNPTRRNRAAAIHNQSERRRRDRINQKMKALQRLVPNASKTDKASMLDEVIEYLKQLQAQIQMMSNRNIPHQQQMMMMMMMPPPLTIQQHQQQLQMSMLARMGVGLGLGLGMGMCLPNMNNTSMAVASTGGPPSLPQLTVGAPAIAPTFVMPSLIQARAHAPPKPEPAASVASTNAPVSLPDPYANFLSQSVNMDIMNSMAALYRQQIRQKNQAISSLSQQHHGQSAREETRNA